MTDTEKVALERRIDELCAENERLRELADGAANEADRLTHDAAALQIENAKLHDEVERLHADQAHWELGNCPSCPNVVSLQEALERNVKLREQTELLVTLLRNDCDIEASWDGLRRFWSIELTENGCLMRDRACKAEAENAKLREFIAEAHENNLLHNNAWCYFLCKHFEGVYWPEGDPCECERCYFADKFNELGIEVRA